MPPVPPADDDEQDRDESLDAESDGDEPLDIDHYVTPEYVAWLKKTGELVRRNLREEGNPQ